MNYLFQNRKDILEVEEKETSGCSQPKGNLCLGLLCFILILYSYSLNIHDTLLTNIFSLITECKRLVRESCREATRIISEKLNVLVEIRDQQNSDNNFHRFHTSQMIFKSRISFLVQLRNFIGASKYFYIIHKWLYRSRV